MIKVGIFFGGKSREREISFAGGRTVYDALDKSLFEAVPIFIDGLGNFIELDWPYIYKGTIRDFFPPYEFLPADSQRFQIYSETLGDAAMDPELLKSIGKPLSVEALKSTIDFAFLALHGAYGQKRYFSGKAKKQGVAVGMSYSVGPSLGIIKPYYLELDTDRRSPNGGVITVVQKYSEENSGTFLDVRRIAGGAGFGYGFDELSLIPGGQGKVALHLDWGAFDEYVRAVEVGLMVDVYARTVPIMLTDDNRPYFINLYFSMAFGKRW